MNRIPLPERMRPTKLEEVVGQDAIIGPGKILTEIVKNQFFGLDKNKNDPDQLKIVIHP